MGISKYVIRLHLSRLLSNMIIGSNFLSKRIFVSEYFRAECCCKISELESVKKFRSGKNSHSATLSFKDIPGEGNFALVSEGLSACWWVVQSRPRERGDFERFLR